MKGLGLVALLALVAVGQAVRADNLTTDPTHIPAGFQWGELNPTPVTFNLNGGSTASISNFELTASTNQPSIPLQTGMVSSFFDVFFELTIQPSGGSPSTTAESFFDIFADLNISPPSTNGSTTTYDTQMTQLDITLPGNMKLNELPSTGQTSVTNVGGSEFRINSFFDI